MLKQFCRVTTVVATVFMESLQSKFSEFSLYSWTEITGVSCVSFVWWTNIMGKINSNNNKVKQKKHRRCRRAGSAAARPVAGICDLSRHDRHLSLLYVVALLFGVAVDRCPCATLAAPLVLHGSTKKPKLNSICISMQTGQDKGNKEWTRRTKTELHLY